jgi:hypothetical protein
MTTVRIVAAMLIRIIARKKTIPKTGATISGLEECIFETFQII